jgi:hypothetical protein
MPKTTITSTIGFGRRSKPEFIRTKNELIRFAVSVSGDSIQSGRLQPLIQQLLIQKYSNVRDLFEDLFDGMTDEQIQAAVNNNGWAFGIKG